MGLIASASVSASAATLSLSPAPRLHESRLRDENKIAAKVEAAMDAAMRRHVERQGPQASAVV